MDPSLIQFSDLQGNRYELNQSILRAASDFDREENVSVSSANTPAALLRKSECTGKYCEIRFWSSLTVGAGGIIVTIYESLLQGNSTFDRYLQLSIIPTIATSVFLAVPTKDLFLQRKWILISRMASLTTLSMPLFFEKKERFQDHLPSMICFTILGLFIATVPYLYKRECSPTREYSTRITPEAEASSNV